MDNLTLLGLGITVIWLGIFGYYFYTSRQQSKIIGDVEKLRSLLEKSEHPDES